MNNSAELLGECVKHQPGFGVSPEPQDADLLESLSNGKAEAFWCLWNRHQEGLRRLCLREMDGRLADAEDALSQVMLRARDRLPCCAGKILRLDAWLHRLGRNLCIDLRRKRLRWTETAERWKDATLAESTADQPMLHAEAESEIQQRIAALPSPLRETFDLHILQAIPAKTVASQLGISPANVRKHAQLARARLRRDLQRCHEGEGHPGRTEDQPRSAPPVELPCRRAKPPQVIPSISIIRTVRVKLPCGVEQLHHVLPPTAPVSPGRRIRSLIVYVQRHPGSWRSRLKLAELFHITGEWNKAVVQWRHVLARRPDLLASLKLGDTLLKLGAPEVAEEVFRLARRQDFQSEATGLHLEGWIAFCQKDNSRSVTQFQAAADIEPENPVHWHGLALARHLAGTAEEALTAIRRALHLNPNDLAACRTFGEDFLK